MVLLKAMSENEQSKEDVMARDLSGADMERAKAPKKTWFFKRLGDGSIIATEALEAWQICFNKSNWKRRDFQLLGTSDGKTYLRLVQESMTEARKLEPVINAKKAELDRYQKSEENLIMNEAVDMEGDPSDKFNEENKLKVLRLRKIQDRIHAELDELEPKFKDLVKNAINHATEAELAVAMKNQEERLAQGLDVDWPEYDLNIITPESNQQGRSKIIGLIGGRRS